MEAPHKIDSRRLAHITDVAAAAHSELQAFETRVRQLFDKNNQISLERQMYVDALGFVKDPSSHPGRKEKVEELSEAIEINKKEIADLRAQQVPITERFQAAKRLETRCKEYLEAN